ncbi:MAG TPA: hypothetical protein VMU37_09375, partial [Caulobacteraceae bacterium]|nr:hypothetical protein [Caulobacteraceae bacterium]
GWRALVSGVLTAVCVSLLVNWPSLLTPLVRLYPTLATVYWMLSLALLICHFIVSASVGLAVSVAVADSAFVGTAFARSFRLMRGLRWRMIALIAAYLFALVLGASGIVLVLGAIGIGYFGAGLGAALVKMGALLITVPTQIAIVSVFLQARRIANGPDIKELHDVFA